MVDSKATAKKRTPFTRKEEDSSGKMKKRHRQKHRESASEIEKKNRKMEVEASAFNNGCNL